MEELLTLTRNGIVNILIPLAIAGAIAGAGVITGVSASLILERVEKYFLIFPRIAELELIQDPFLWETVLVILKNENFDSIRLLDLLS